LLHIDMRSAHSLHDLRHHLLNHCLALRSYRSEACSYEDLSLARHVQMPFVIPNTIGRSMMRTLLLTAALTLALPLAAQEPHPAAAQPAFKAHVLKHEELDKLLATPGKVLLIDVRRPDEVSTKGGFPVYLSIQAGDLEKSLDYIPKDRLIVTVSNHAARAGKAADLLSSKGYKVAGAIGSETYETEGGHAIVHIAPPAKAATAN
jgi:rhodanese-related sulfurtransferase